MPCASSRSSASVACTSPRSSSSIVETVAGSDSTSWRARPTFTARATRCCCAPSWRLRSIRRRDSSAAVTMRNREAWSSWFRSCSVSRLAWSAESRRTLCEREADLAGELGEDPLGLVGERHRVLRPLGHDQAEQDPRVHDRRDPHDCVAAVLDQARHPYLEPRVARHPGPRTPPAAPPSRGRGGGVRGRAPRPPGRARRRCRSRPRPRRAACSASVTRRAAGAARPWARHATCGCRTSGSPRRVSGARRRPGGAPSRRGCGAPAMRRSPRGRRRPWRDPAGPAPGRRARRRARARR